MKTNKLIMAASLTLLLAGSGCTKLEETLNGELSGDQVAGGGSQNVASLLTGVYNSMRLPYQDQSRMWAAQEHTSDEVIGPTRGGDWDDNGVWRVMHQHKWDADHLFLRQTYEDLGGIIFSSTDLLRYNPTPQQAAEARFLRAFAMFSVLDGWDQVPFREPGSDILAPPTVKKGLDALNFIIAEVTAALPGLPAGPANRANQDAARVLLMKLYLNKGVIANRKAPTFAPADMNEVIKYADQVIASSRGYSLATNFYDNFAPTNDVISTENIWTAENIGGSNSGNVRSRWFCTLHYNNNPSGWNGFTTLSNLYDKFTDSTDMRRTALYTGQSNVSGLRVGFLVGQQYNQNGVALKNRKGAPLSFTRDVKVKETGNNLEVTGIRVLKYPIDYTGGDNSNNDYVYFRLADVILMKAEAILRGGTATGGATPLSLVNSIRTRRNAQALTAVTLDNLIDERGRELYWEGWRRQDQIRFGKFLLAWQEKDASGDERLLFPIPNQQLAANPNLTQNPGY